MDKHNAAHPHSGGYSSVTGNRAQTPATTWINLENIIQKLVMSTEVPG